MTLRQNNFEGGTNGTALTTANSGSTSGTAFDIVVLGATATAKFSTAKAAHGTKSLLVTPAGTGNYAAVVWTLAGTPTTMVARQYFYLNALPTDPAGTMFSVSGSTATDISAFYIFSDGTPYLDSFGGSLYFGSAGTIAAGQWYRMEVMFNLGTSSTTGQAKFLLYSLDSTTPLVNYSATNVNLNGGTGDYLTNVQFGHPYSSSDTSSFYIDDIAINDGSVTLLGPVTATPPTVSAPQAQTVEPWSTVTLTGTYTAGSGAITGTTWTQTSGTAVTLTGANTTTATFTAPAAIADANIGFTFAVTDSNAQTVTGTTTVKVLAATERAVVGGKEVPMQISLVGSGAGTGGGGTTSSGLTAWYAAINNRANAGATALFIGDSLTEGQGASAKVNRWLDRFSEYIRSAYVTTGVTAPGVGYIPSNYATYGPDSPWGPLSSDSVTGTHTYNVSNSTEKLSLGVRWDLMSAGATWVKNVTGTSVDIWWAQGFGSFTYKIDGGTAVTVNTSTGTTGKPSLTHVSLGTSGSHTVTITATSAIHFGGIMVYNGDEAKGIRVVDSGHTGYRTDQFLGMGATWALVNPDLVVIELGSNDCIQNANSAAVVKANIKQLIADVRASVSKSCSIALLGMTSASLPSSWPSYVTAIQSIVTDDPTVVYIDMGAMTKTASDGLHPNDAGHDDIGVALFNALALPVMTTMARPSGTAYVRYEDLQTGGLTMRQIIAKVPNGKILTLPDGIYEIQDFNDPQGFYEGLRVLPNCAGIIGSGRNTIIRMTANSSTFGSYANGLSTAGQSNYCTIIGCATSGQTIQNLQLQGTNQGHEYNGLQMYGEANAHVTGQSCKNVYFNGFGVGSGNFPPHETMQLGVFDSDNFSLVGCEFDGRNPTTKTTGWSASPVGFSVSSGAFVQDVYAHHNKFSMPTFYMVNGIHTVNLRSQYNYIGINHEDISGTVLHESPMLICDHYTNPAANVHTSIGNATTVGNDPNISFTNVIHDAGPFSGCFAMYVYDNYVDPSGAGNAQTSVPTVSKNGTSLALKDANLTDIGDPNKNYFRFH